MVLSAFGHVRSQNEGDNCALHGIFESKNKKKREAIAGKELQVSIGKIDIYGDYWQLTKGYDQESLGIEARKEEMNQL